MHIAGRAGDLLTRREVEGDASDESLRQLIERVDRIAEIPNSLRRGTAVRLQDAEVRKEQTL
jgi:hypothetical protein